MNQSLRIDKPAYNDEQRTFQWRRPDGQGQLNSDETLVVCSVTCIDSFNGVDASNDMISEVAIYDDTQCRYRLKGGVVNRLYFLIFRATSSNNQKLEDRVILRVV